MIYLDNAATTFPKPREVVEKTIRAVTGPWGNPGRSSHPLSVDSANAVFDARESVATLLGLKECENLVFTGGATQALNMAIQGAVEALEQKKHQPVVVTDPLEHNSVLRPLYRLERQGRIRLHLLSPNPFGDLPLDTLWALRPDLAVFTARSNLTGHRFSLSRAAEKTKPFGTLWIVDGAGAVGEMGCSFQETGAHVICGSGHKGLFGLMGGGFLAVSPTSPVIPEAILCGGSGNDSFNPRMPENLPERLEAGTLPLPAILSMGAGAEFLLKLGLDTVTRHERRIKRMLCEGILNLPRYTVYEPQYPDGPLLINHKTLPPEILAKNLEEDGIYTRAGFHCAPLGHRYLSTSPTGALRLSPGLFTREDEILKTLDALAKQR